MWPAIQRIGFEWSLGLARDLYLLGRRYELHAYPGSDHFFEGEARVRAADLDARFFRSLMASAR